MRAGPSEFLLTITPLLVIVHCFEGIVPVVNSMQLPGIHQNRPTFGAFNRLIFGLYRIARNVLGCPCRKLTDNKLAEQPGVGEISLRYSHEFEHMAVRAAKIEAAPAVPVVELAVVKTPRCAAIG